MSTHASTGVLGWLGALEVRALGPQFEDDLNTLPMPGFTVVDLSVARELAWHIEVFAAVQNLFGTQFLVGRAGVDTIGEPTMLRAGLRFRS